MTDRTRDPDVSDFYTVGLTITRREDGGVRIYSSIPGMYLAGNDIAAVFADLGPVMQRLLIDNEGVEWLRSAPTGGR